MAKAGYSLLQMKGNVMKQIFRVIMCVALFAGLPAFADFQKGYDASKKGDYATALREWRPIAENGDAVAQYNLGLMYDRGWGVPQDYKEAAKWYTLSAEQGYSEAQTGLGWLFGLGYGIPQDYVRAHMWYNLSASNGDKDGAEGRDIVAKKMTTEQIAEAQKLARQCVAKSYKGC